VLKGAPVKVWELTCEPCEAYLSGARKPKVLRYDIDPKTRTVTGQSRVADSDPMWSSTADTVPLTPDEQKTHHLKIERGEQQLRALESVATLIKAGIDFRDRPDILFFLRQHQLPEDIIQGTVVCLNGHDCVAGTKFCPECGVAMAARGALPPAGDGAGDADLIDLEMLHPQSLKKLLRQRGLSDRGSKDQMIQRLRQAA